MYYLTPKILKLTNFSFPLSHREAVCIDLTLVASYTDIDQLGCLGGDIHQSVVCRTLDDSLAYHQQNIQDNRDLRVICWSERGRFYSHLLPC